MRVTVSVPIPGSPTEVWRDLADLSSHAEWMADAEAVEIVSEPTSGVGTVMWVPTRIGPLSTEDWIIVTGWVEGERIDVVHVGLVTGAGSIIIDSDGDSTVVRWDEELSLPLYFGGSLGEVVAKPVLTALWRGNLRRLAARFVS
ncbi:MAG: SRPBCC family protein [Acidimicrobiia bacterium]